MGNASTEKVTHIGHVPGMLCNKRGEEVDDVVISDVSFCSTAPFNLISIPQLLKKGWKLGGDDETIWVTAPGGVKSVVFDIVVLTKTGCIYAACIK